MSEAIKYFGSHSFSETGAPKTPADARRRKLNILVVDDSEETRKLICRALRQIDFGVDVNPLEAGNGAEALHLIKRGLVDVVLADWRMPEMNGLEMLKKIRQSEQLSEVPVIMLTAAALREDVMEAVRAGVTDYILKPFTIKALEEKIKPVLIGRG
ncbi:MAG: response regulator [Nitrospinota bacterium]